MATNLPDHPLAPQIDRLQRPLRSRRWLSWILFLSVLLLCLVVPVLASLSPPWLTDLAGKRAASPVATVPAATTAAGTTAAASGVKPTLLKLDAKWNPGTLASVHQPWAQDCKACHSAPFVRVKDADCLACHKTIGDHVSVHVGEKLKHETATLSGLGEMRCASCHRDHQGEFGLATQNKRYVAHQCADCHADIRKTFPETQTQDVSDFGRRHPEFRVQIAQANDLRKLIRVRHTASGTNGTMGTLTETTSLKFPHDVHLAKAGISSPNGKVKMTCADCHQPNADGAGFKPVTMKAQCQSCHALKFDAAVFNREVPHGSVDEVLAMLREFYSYVGMNGVPPVKAPSAGPVSLMRPGKEAPLGSFVRSPGDVRTQAAAAATELFEKTSCVICHEVTRLPGVGKPGTPGQDLPQWRIAPVTPTHAWMPKAEFSHAKHRNSECTDCHAAPASKKASDVLMPTIKECRDCHAGNQPEKNKVVSDCGLCHGFHPPTQHAVAAASKPAVATPEKR